MGILNILKLKCTLNILLFLYLYTAIFTLTANIIIFCSKIYQIQNQNIFDKYIKRNSNSFKHNQNDKSNLNSKIISITYIFFLLNIPLSSSLSLLNIYPSRNLLYAPTPLRLISLFYTTSNFLSLLSCLILIYYVSYSLKF